jgi:hypothetical protein
VQPAACQKASKKEFRKNGEFHTGENTLFHEIFLPDTPQKQSYSLKQLP